jgi:hypothetical protein
MNAFPLPDYRQMPQQAVTDDQVAGMADMAEGMVNLPAGVLAKLPGLLGITKRIDDLPMDEASRMGRARDMGFDKDVYRGANFDADSMPEGITYTTESPETASDFATYLRTWQGANVAPLKIKGNYLEVDGNYNSIRQAEKSFGSEVMGLTDEDYPNGLEIYDYAKSKGYDGVKFNNVVDDPLGPNIPKPTSVFATFNNKNIRSKFAKFDPSKADSSNILAGATGAALLGSMAYPEDD